MEAHRCGGGRGGGEFFFQLLLSRFELFHLRLDPFGRGASQNGIHQDILVLDNLGQFLLPDRVVIDMAGSQTAALGDGRAQLAVAGWAIAGLPGLFVPLDTPVAAGVPVTQPLIAEVPPPVVVELSLRDGCGLCFDSALDPVALPALIRAVDAA